MTLKKLFAGLISLTAALFAVCAITVCAGAQTSGDYEYEVLSNTTVSITDYIGSATNLTIPSTLGGKKVTRIGDNAFEFCSTLTSVTIPDGVTRIGDYAFHECLKLASINIPDSITSIGVSAFSRTAYSDNQSDTVKYVGKWAIGCEQNATTATIKNGTVGIADKAFGCKYYLKSITIPASVTIIGNSAFYSSPEITSINLNKDNPKYALKDNVLYNKAMTSLIACPGAKQGKYIIPNGVKKIEDNAFYGCGDLTSITIPNGVTSIGDSAFCGCYSLVSVTIPASVTSIGKQALYLCSRLTSVTVDKNNMKYASKDGVLFNKDMTQVLFCPGGKQGEYKIPNGVKTIGDNAFDYCTQLTSITIPNSVTYIGNYAFSSCSRLTSVNIADSVTKIGTCAFFSCGFTSITIPDGVKSIGDSAFYECFNLASITIPASVTSIGQEAFGLRNLPEQRLKNVYYTGSKAQWDKINISDYNEYMFKANIHYLNLGISGLKLKARSADALRLSWTKNTSADGYIIEQKSGSNWVRVAKISKNTTTEYRISKLKAGTAYSFRVKAYKMSGKTAFYSGYVTISARTNPSAVSSLKLKARASDALRLSWAKNTSADGYILERKDGNKWVRVAKITKNTTTEYRISKLKAGTAYNFRVKAYKMSGKTALYSGYTTISARTNPSVVSGLKLKNANSTAVRLSWTKNTSADGYIIEMKSGGKWVRVGKITKNSTVEFRKGSLKSKTSYSFRIKTYKMSGSTALYSAYNTITVKTK